MKPDKIYQSRNPMIPVREDAPVHRAFQSWIWLLRHYGEKVSFWLFLCLFGFLYSSWLTGESLGIFTLAGTLIKLAALAINVRNKKL
ncbi:hypothetical protein BH10BAC3_BH10BAC3_14850 [soil metagenome]